MKQSYIWSLIALFLGLNVYAVEEVLSHPLHTVSRVKEIAVVYNHNLVDHFNTLSAEERVFIYYLFRASLAGNVIAADQCHRDAPQIMALLEYVLRKKDELVKKDTPFDTDQFLADVETYLVYMWTNHSQYFVREHADEKRTPGRLKLKILTQENLSHALSVLEYGDGVKAVQDIAASLFDTTCEPTLAVPDSIDKSAVNFYAPGFTDEDFLRLDSKDQSTLNAYFYIDESSGKRVPVCQKYSVDGKYAQELKVIVHWLEKAHAHVQQHPQRFDVHLVKSLAYLIEYFKTGDEEVFKKHSIEWLKSNSRVDYVFGFIETYQDPKSYRALFQSDVTIKSLDMDTLNSLLPAIERRLPIKKEFMRQSLDGAGGGMPNASINVKAFSAGSLGPINLTLAYCLPNYGEIRAQEGSKQVIYHAEKGLGELMNPQVAHRLFNGSEHYEWFEKHDPDYQLMRDIFMLEVILHETLGHGSGKLTTHTFQEGENSTIEGKAYKVGDTIPVTSSNIQQLLGGYGQGLEELRAEIIALLASIECYDDFASIGMLKEWPQKVAKEKIIDFSIINMARTGLRRLVQQADTATRIAGAHAQANTTILNFLLDRGAVELRTEQVTINDKQYTMLDAYILDRNKALDAIVELANSVQQIKSTGDGLRAQWLIETYGTYINAEYMRIMKENLQAAVGDIKVSAALYPIYMPHANNNGDIVDIKTRWPENIVQAYQLYRELSLSTSDYVL